MAEGNGEIIEEMATTHKTDGNGEPERTPDYPKLVEYGLDKRVMKNLFSHRFSNVFVVNIYYFLHCLLCEYCIFRWQPN